MKPDAEEGEEAEERNRTIFSCAPESENHDVPVCVGLVSLWARSVV